MSQVLRWRRLVGLAVEFRLCEIDFMTKFGKTKEVFSVTADVEFNVDRLLTPNSWFDQGQVFATGTRSCK